MMRHPHIEVPCTVEIEQTSDSLHAHVELDGVTVSHGDTVLVHDAPTGVGEGDRLVCRRSATVVRGGRFARLRARLAGYRGLTELFEVGFSAGRIR